jgi:hypothetical protein
MSIYSRVDFALEHSRAADVEIAQAESNPDPVQQRRALVRAAKHLRVAADELDDHGRLTE